MLIEPSNLTTKFNMADAHVGENKYNKNIIYDA